MKYGELTLNVKAGTLSIRKSKSQLVRHYPATDISDVSPLGKEPTIITCTLIALTDTERINYEAILSGDNTAELEISNFYYKDVISSANHTQTSMRGDTTNWLIDAEFTALNPVPYSSSTDEVLY